MSRTKLKSFVKQMCDTLSYVRKSHAIWRDAQLFTYLGDVILSIKRLNELHIVGTAYLVDLSAEGLGYTSY